MGITLNVFLAATNGTNSPTNLSLSLLGLTAHPLQQIFQAFLLVFKLPAPTNYPSSLAFDFTSKVKEKERNKETKGKEKKERPGEGREGDQGGEEGTEGRKRVKERKNLSDWSYFIFLSWSLYAHLHVYAISVLLPSCWKRGMACLFHLRRITQSEVCRHYGLSLSWTILLPQILWHHK